jgi:hypothetical protein
MAKRSRANQGQVLIIAALVIAMMLLSTALYIADTQKSQMKVQAEIGLNLPFYKQGLQHTMVSALANISIGGDTGILQTDLNEFNQFVSDHSFDSFFTSTITLRNTAPYQNGVWKSQNISGQAVVGAYASFSVNSSGTKDVTQSAFDVNVTSMIQTQGYYTQQDTIKQVQLTCKVFNDGQPALAGNFSVQFEQDGNLDNENWVNVETPVIIDHGDGTYTISFEAVTDQPENPLIVWFSCMDQRGITLQTIVEPVLQ